MNRVLIIDDEEDIRLLGRLLLRDRYDVADAGNASEAWSLLSSFRPDVVLLDIRLPDQDGWTMLDRMRHDGLLQETRVVMVSAHAMSEAPKQAFAAGARGYIRKPFTADELLDTIDRVLNDPAESV